MKLNPLLLLLPLAWPSLALSEPAPQQTTAHVWQQSQRTNAADGSAYTRFTLVGTFLTPQQAAAADRPALVMDCVTGSESHSKGKLRAGALLIGPAVKIIYVEPEEIHAISYFPMVDIHLRSDDSKEEKQQWSAGAEKTSAFIPRDSLKKILRARTVAITADNEQGSKVTMRFDIPDPTLVEEGCNVDRH
jgi:hypothetical protein